MGALILHPMVPREERDEALAALRAAHWAEARAWGEGADAGVEAAEWALSEIQRANARTLHGRIFVVAAAAMEPDVAIDLLREVLPLAEDLALRVAVRRLARTVL